MDSQIDKKMIDVIKRDNTWEFMSKFIRAVYPMLIVLRLADKKDPVMDKLFFYVRRMDQTIEQSKTMLDGMDQLMQTPSWRSIKDLGKTDIPDDDSDATEDDAPHVGNTNDDDGDSSDSSSILGSTNKNTLGGQVQSYWMKRRCKLVTDYAIAGWLLSPIPDIYICKRNMHGYCGRGIGEERFGQFRRCPECDKKKAYSLTEL